MTGATKLVNINSFLLEEGRESVSSRRIKHRFRLLFKMQNDLSPDYLFFSLPSFMGNTSSYPLRNAAVLRTRSARSQLYYNISLSSADRDRIDLPIFETRNLTSIASFVRKLSANLLTLLKYMRGKTAQIYHGRLRTICSSFDYQFVF